MAVFNAAKREIDIKIVYYGPALCGKTTNVQCIHRMLAPGQRGELMSLATKDDRTLFFDFLPIELGDVKGFKTRFHVYTVPGQVYYALTRRAVLTGVDGIVFVADSQTSKLQENIESLNDLKENLTYYKKDLAAVPFILQYNKRDLGDILPIEELNSALNAMRVPFYSASALQGTGVVETLTAICKAVLKQMDKTGGKKARPTPPTAPPMEPTFAAPPEQPAEATGPVIKIFSDTAAGTEPAPATPRLDDVAFSPDFAFDKPAADEPLRLREDASRAAPEPEFNIDTYAVPSEPVDTSFRIDETPTTTDFGPLSLSDETAGTLSIISCGQPQKLSETMMKVPITVRVGGEDRQRTITITISLD